MANKAKIREEARKLVPIDDVMFRKMAEDLGFCQEILRVIMNDPALEVLDKTPQYVVTNLQGRSVILDAHCKLGDCREIDIEVQKANDDNHQKRVRYNGSVLTANIMDPGEKFENVPDVCVVFISRFDMFEDGISLYHVDRVVRETGKVVDNGFEEIYVMLPLRIAQMCQSLWRFSLAIRHTTINFHSHRPANADTKRQRRVKRSCAK